MENTIMDLSNDEVDKKLIWSLVQLKTDKDCCKNQNDDMVSATSFRHESTVTHSETKKFKMDEINCSPLTDMQQIPHDSFLQGYLSAKPYLYLKGDKGHFTDNCAFARYGFEELRLIIQWSSKVPEFCQLDVSNKTAMLQASYMNIIVIRLAFRSLDLLDNGRFRFTQNNILGVEDVISLGWSRELAEGTLKMTRILKELEVDVVEFSILLCVILTSPDALGISGPMNVMKMQSHMMGHLQTYMTNRGPGGHKRFSKLLLSLTFLRQIGNMSMERYNSLNSEGFILLGQIYRESIVEDHKQMPHFSTVNPLDAGALFPIFQNAHI